MSAVNPSHPATCKCSMCGYEEAIATVSQSPTIRSVPYHRRDDHEGAHELELGEYMRDRDGRWWGCTPNGLLANLANHTVTEHEDGSISVSPSILVRQSGVGEWHGFLERGEWRSV